VPVEVQQYAYLTGPLPIGFDKTISQPLMVAVMTDLLELKPDDVVLEIGTGLGHQPRSSPRWQAGYTASKSSRNWPNGRCRGWNDRATTTSKSGSGTGSSGWPEHAPFHKVIVTAASDLIPPPLINQLKAGGRMVIPVGLSEAQRLVVAEKNLRGRFTMKEIMRVLFSLLEGADEPAHRVSWL
jgi:protein-L-isoaspartate(D-aspartate) O-methyltransferase